MSTSKPMRGFLTIILGLSGCLGCSGRKSEIPPTPLPPPSIVSVKPGPSLLHARSGHRAILLPDGRVAIIGGVDPEIDCIPECEIYDPDANKFIEGGRLQIPRISPALHLMTDGRVLVIGGSSTHPYSDLADLEVWDPLAKTSTWVGTLQIPQGQGVSAWRLPDGALFVTGGAWYHDPERLDTTTWTSTVLPFQATNKALGAAVAPLPNGDVVLAGGTNGGITFSDRWIYHWQTGLFEPLDPLANSRSGANSIILGDGRWLVIGGVAAFGGPAEETIEIYADPSGTRLAVTPGAGSVGGTATLLPDGRVLLVGGANILGMFNNVGVNTTRVFDPDKGNSTSGETLADGRWSHTATTLRDKRIMVIGGTTGIGALASTAFLTIH